MQPQLLSSVLLQSLKVPLQATLKWCKRHCTNVSTLTVAANVDIASGTRILIVGPKDSGKTTLFKQSRLLCHGDYSVDQRLFFKALLWHQVIHDTIEAIREAERLDLGIRLDETQESIGHFATLVSSVFSAHDASQLHSPEMAGLLGQLWTDDLIERVLAERRARRETELITRADQLLDRLAELAKPNFLPSNEHILRTKFSATGFLEIVGHFSGLSVRFLDSSSSSLSALAAFHARSPCDVIYYCVSLRDLWTKRADLVDLKRPWKIFATLEGFQEMVNHPLLADLSLVVFLTHLDNFENHLIHNPSCFTRVFPEFRSRGGGAGGFEACLQHLAAKFRTLIDESAQVSSLPEKAGGDAKIAMIRDGCAARPRTFSCHAVSLLDTPRVQELLLEVMRSQEPEDEELFKIYL